MHESQIERFVIEFESALDSRGVNSIGGVVRGASSGGESINVGGSLSSFCSTSIKSSLGGIAGITLDLLATVHGGGDNEVISGASCCVEGGAEGSGGVLEF